MIFTVTGEHEVNYITHKFQINGQNIHQNAKS